MKEKWKRSTKVITKKLFNPPKIVKQPHLDLDLTVPETFTEGVEMALMRMMVKSS